MAPAFAKMRGVMPSSLWNASFKRLPVFTALLIGTSKNTHANQQTPIVKTVAPKKVPKKIKRLRSVFTIKKVVGQASEEGPTLAKGLESLAGACGELRRFADGFFYSQNGREGRLARSHILTRAFA